MKNAAYANIVDTGGKLRQRMQDAENYIRTAPGVCRRFRDLFRRRADARVHTHGGYFGHLL
jgi:hypothetical protein